MRVSLSGSVLALLTVLLWSGAAAAGDRTYRWTDAQGRVHYSDVRNEKGEPVEVKPGRGIDKAPKDSPAAVAARQVECQRRKDQVLVYNSSAQISETDSLGNTRTYTPEERQKLIDRAQQQVLEACGASADNAQKP